MVWVGVGVVCGEEVKGMGAKRVIVGVYNLLHLPSRT